MLLKKTRPSKARKATRVSNAFDSGTLQLTDGTMMTSSEASEVGDKPLDHDRALSVLTARKLQAKGRAIGTMWTELAVTVQAKS